MEKRLSEFWIAGVNYKKTDATIRGQYAINPEQYSTILKKATDYGLKEFFILSTCNRTEIYGLTPNVDFLVDLVCSETAGDKQTFQQLAYVKNGRAAIEHLFHVSAGLDSQVLGDYEIIGQVKTAAKISKKQGYIGPFMERLINSTLQSSKAIKTRTELSGGTVSVSFGAVQYIREHVADYSQKKILLIGTGKIGRNTCKNLIDYLDNKNITLVNRTLDKAAALAADQGVQYAPLEQLDACINDADIIITSTNATQPIITKANIGNTSRLIIDLAIPYNVDVQVAELEHITLMNVDELSKLKDDTLQRRKAEIPKAVEIIDTHIDEFISWLETRKYAPLLRSLKIKLQEIEHSPLMAGDLIENSASEERLRKIINTTAIKLQTHNTRGCHYIEAINEFIAR